MVYIYNLYALPLLILLWAIDTWLLLGCIRFVTHQLAESPSNPLMQTLRKVTDSPPCYIQELAFSRGNWHWPMWMCWTVTIVLAVIVRSMLITLLMQAK